MLKRPFGPSGSNDFGDEWASWLCQLVHHSPLPLRTADRRPEAAAEVVREYATPFAAA